jgi:hypothetical protein
MLCIQSIMFIKHNYSNFAQIHISTKYCGIKDYLYFTPRIIYKSIKIKSNKGKKRNGFTQKLS